MEAGGSQRGISPTLRQSGIGLMLLTGDAVIAPASFFLMWVA